MQAHEEHAAVLALTAARDHDWHQVAALIVQAGSAQQLLARDLAVLPWWERERASALVQAVTPELLQRQSGIVTRLRGRDAALVTVLDATYPRHLRRTHDLPPFLVVRGELGTCDKIALAITGVVRTDSDMFYQGRELAVALARRQITVVASLDSDLDRAVLQAALDAGGRVIAVLASGVDYPYPVEHEPLRRQIATAGALVSVTWPDAPATPASIRLRDAALSGLGLGLTVLGGQADGETSRQAQRCLEHDRRLLLPRSLVLGEEWVKYYADYSGATVVDGIEGVLEAMRGMVEVHTHLTGV